MRPIPAPRLGDTHGLLRAINQRDRLRLDEFITEFSIEELFPPGLENALGRTRQFVSFARSAGLLKEDRGVVELTEIGKRYVRSGDEAAVFDVSSGQAEWLRRQLFERHMTDSIYHGAAIGLSLYASNPPDFHVSRLDFGRALAHLGRAGWDNENTLESQGERYTTFLRDLELLDAQSLLTEIGSQTKSELTLPVHMSLRDLAGQLNPGGPRGRRGRGRGRVGRAAAEPEPEPEPEPVAEEPAAPRSPPPRRPPPVIDTGEYEDVAGAATASRSSRTEQSGRPIPPSDIWETAAPDEATRAYSSITPEQAAAAAVDPAASAPPPSEAEAPADAAPPPADEMTSGDPLAAGGMTSGDPLAQPTAEEPVDVEGPGVESAEPEVAAEPAAEAPVPVVEVPADLARRRGRRGRARARRRRRGRDRRCARRGHGRRRAAEEAATAEAALAETAGEEPVAAEPVAEPAAVEPVAEPAAAAPVAGRRGRRASRRARGRRASGRSPVAGSASAAAEGPLPKRPLAGARRRR